MQKALVALAERGNMSIEALSSAAGVSMDDAQAWLAEATRFLPIQVEMHQVHWAGAISPLDADHSALRAIDGLTVIPLCLSTNDEVFRLLAEGVSSCVVVSEMQTDGRGQHGRRWIASWASGITLTVGQRCPSWPTSAAALPLAVGVHVAEALETRLGEAVKVKWPNDLYLHGRKLGGILVESRFVASGESQFAIGLGINLRPPEQNDASLERPAAAIGDILPQNVVNQREPWIRLLAESIRLALNDALSETPRWHDAWSHRDWLRGHACSVERGGMTLSGIAEGVDEGGRLRFRDRDGVIHHLDNGRVRRI